MGLNRNCLLFDYFSYAHSSQPEFVNNGSRRPSITSIHRQVNNSDNSACGPASLNLYHTHTPLHIIYHHVRPRFPGKPEFSLYGRPIGRLGTRVDHNPYPSPTSSRPPAPTTRPSYVKTSQNWDPSVSALSRTCSFCQFFLCPARQNPYPTQPLLHVVFHHIYPTFLR